MDKKVLTRIMTGTIMGVIVLSSFIIGGIPLSLVLLTIIFLGSKELVNILNVKGYYPSLGVVLISDVILTILAYFHRFDLLLVTIAMCSVWGFVWVLFKSKKPYIANAATTIFCQIYSGLFTLYLIFMRDLGSEPIYDNFIKQTQYNEGLWAVIIVFFGVLLTDTGCYFFGTKFGKNKLAPSISPNKSIEGSVGGTISALAGCLILCHFAHIAWYHSIVIALLISFFAQTGDLFESLIKRDAGVKDSGNLLPGHGGFLDRSDSYVFTLPVLYYYFKFFVFDNGIINVITTFFKGFM